MRIQCYSTRVYLSEYWGVGIVGFKVLDYWAVGILGCNLIDYVLRINGLFTWINVTTLSQISVIETTIYELSNAESMQAPKNTSFA